MKGLIFLLCFPFLAYTQTIHFDGKNIVYEGAVTLPASPDFTRLQPAVIHAIEDGKVNTVLSPNRQALMATGTLSLEVPFPLTRLLHFSLYITTTKNGYAYRIDSVYLTEKQRGCKTINRTSAEDLLEGREETGAGATANERLLNEIDMRFQKILALLRRNLQHRER